MCVPSAYLCICVYGQAYAIIDKKTKIFHMTRFNGQDVCRESTKIPTAWPWKLWSWTLRPGWNCIELHVMQIINPDMFVNMYCFIRTVYGKYNAIRTKRLIWSSRTCAIWLKFGDLITFANMEAYTKTDTSKLLEQSLKRWHSNILNLKLKVEHRLSTYSYVHDQARTGRTLSHRTVQWQYTKTDGSSIG